MGQKTKSSVLEIRVRLLCEFIKDCDTEILLIHITFHPREQDRFVTTSGNNRSSWKKFDPRTFLKLPIQIWSLLCLQSTQSKPTLSCKSPLAATSMYIFMQTNEQIEKSEGRVLITCMASGQELLSVFYPKHISKVLLYFLYKKEVLKHTR